MPSPEEISKYRPRKPLAATSDLSEADKVMPHIQRLRYPIESPTDLVEQLGGRDATLVIEGVQVSPHRMMRYLSARYFPISSSENFRAKIAELIRQQRDPVDLHHEVQAIRQQLPSLKYPIDDHDGLIKQLAGKKFKFYGREVYPEIATHHVPRDIFPIVSEQDFHKKIEVLIRTMVNRPIIAAD